MMTGAVPHPVMSGRRATPLSHVVVIGRAFPYRVDFTPRAAMRGAVHGPLPARLRLMPGAFARGSMADVEARLDHGTGGVIGHTDDRSLRLYDRR